MGMTIPPCMGTLVNTAARAVETPPATAAAATVIAIQFFVCIKTFSLRFLG
jgi:hypothetical protein